MNQKWTSRMMGAQKSSLIYYFTSSFLKQLIIGNWSWGASEFLLYITGLVLGPYAVALWWGHYHVVMTCVIEGIHGAFVGEILKLIPIHKYAYLTLQDPLRYPNCCFTGVFVAQKKALGISIQIDPKDDEKPSDARQIATTKLGIFQ